MFQMLFCFRPFHKIYGLRPTVLLKYCWNRIPTCLYLYVFSWFSPPSSYSFNLVFFIFYGSFSNFFSASHECELRNRSGLLFLFYYLLRLISLLLNADSYVSFGKFYRLLTVKIFVCMDSFTIPFLFLSYVRGLFCGGEFFGRVFE